MADLVRTSKFLSYILRHGAKEMGLLMDSSGFVNLNDILKLKELSGITMETIYKIVDTNDKKRFEILNDGSALKIRAVQGHSITTIEEKEIYKKIVDPNEIPICVHGTYLKNWDIIKKSGLKVMNRTHIHMAKGLPKEEDVISGMRSSCQVIVYIDVEKAFSDNIEFLESKNGVILTKGIDGTLPTKYFKKVVNRKTGQSLL